MLNINFDQLEEKDKRFIFPPHPIKEKPVKEEIEKYTDPKYVAELKINDTRLELHKNDGKFTFTDRRGTKLTYTPSPDLIKQLEKMNIPDNTVLDGGLLHFKWPHVKHCIVFWDVIKLEGKVPETNTYEERRELLEKVTGLKTYRNRNFRKLYKWILENLKLNNIILSPQHIGKDFFDFYKFIEADKEYSTFRDKLVSGCLFEGLVVKNKEAKLTISYSSTPPCGSMVKFRRASTKYDY